VYPGYSRGMRRAGGVHLPDAMRALRPRRTAGALLRAFAEHDLLTYASAISFQAFFALIPLALTALGLLGELSLQEVWNDHLARDLQPQVSAPVFAVIDETVRRVLDSRQLFWATFGAVLTVWEVSGAMRAVMTVLDRIYRNGRERLRVPRYAVSLLLSALVTVLMLGAAGAIVVGGLVDGAASAIARWPLAALLLLAALWAVVHWAPSERRPWRWVTFGSLLVVVAWLGMSAGFGAYLRGIADYGSIFGNLATLIVTLEYLYLTSIVFLAGLTLDAITQEGTG
jgi:membrane protein